jgi:aspartyl-tRNA synthetase
MQVSFMLCLNRHKLQQLLMVGGMDKYFQIKMFRDEDLRADRHQSLLRLTVKWLLWNKKILNVFEGLTRHLLKEIKGIEVDKFP